MVICPARWTKSLKKYYKLTGVCIRGADQAQKNLSNEFCILMDVGRMAAKKHPGPLELGC
jgi:hypothetical protein